MGARTTIEFERIQRSKVVNTKCTGLCKQRHRKVVKVEHTVNPFNRNQDGTVKTRGQVLDAVLLKLGDEVDKYTLSRIKPPCPLCGGAVVEVKPRGR